MFKALVVDKAPDFAINLRDVDDDFLPEGDVTLSVDYSTINYKDALAITNRSPIVRNWPMVVGVDGAGTVLESSNPAWQPGDHVILNGFGVGESHKGCLAQRARLKGDWLVRRPSNITSRQAMAIGTAGYTAMLCIIALEKHGITKGDGEILVTGATGGVGSIAIALLAQLGYTVIAATGKLSQEPYLRSLGASGVIEREKLAIAGKPLQKERWAAAIDTLGSHTLANICAQMKYGGAVAACGLAQGADLSTTVMPFILRGVALLGIDSVMAPLSMRQQAWERLARDLPLSLLDTMTTEITLPEVPKAAADMMDGKISGRFVVRTSE
jgi:acrylyl-CoA reductase (NADPH)